MMFVHLYQTAPRFCEMDPGNFGERGALCHRGALREGLCRRDRE